MNRKKSKSKKTLILFAIIGGVVRLALSVCLVLLLINTVGGKLSVGTKGAGENLTSGLNAKLNLIDSILEEQFLFDRDVDYESAIIKGYVEALDDPYTVYYTEEEYQELQQSMSGEYSGIGVVVQQDSNMTITVVRAYKNCPGANAGIMKDDIITGVDGEDIVGQDISLVVSKIKGPAGTSVTITVYRPSEKGYIDLTMERASITIESVTYELLENKIGYIALTSFDSPTYSQFVEAYSELEAQGMEALIVDLRDNGGGLLTSVVDILDDILPAGTITYTEDKNGNSDLYTSDSYTMLDIPMVTLVNGNSASASEIFTGAVQDYGVSTIMGTQTFGKGIVQVVYPLGDGSALKLTTSRYFTPNGVCIHGVGITPDIIVEDSILSDEDDQLEAAIDFLINEIK